MTLSAGSRLGPYEILSPLGAGGMGEVYRARDTRVGRDVAVKVLPAPVADDGARLRRFEVEARAAAALNHPNVLMLLDVGSEGGTPYVVTELLEGETLRDRLRLGALPPRKATDVAAQAARGLGAAHAKGIVHRDLKPENLFLTPDGRVKILDFGLAKLTHPETPGSGTGVETALPTVSEAGQMLGTVGYMAPEQVEGKTVGPPADVFSLGTVLYEMLSGRRAFQGVSVVDTLHAILRQEPPDLPQGGAIPQGLERIVRRCLEKQPAERFQSARDLAFALETLSGSGVGSSVDVRPTTLGRAQRPWLRRTTLAIGACALLAGGFAAARLTTPPEREPPWITRLTFRRQGLWQARFAPDGQTIVYAANVRDQPLELFATRVGSTEARSLGIKRADVLAISPNGELALKLGESLGPGTLAQMPFEGGTPRELLKNVSSADWTPDGKALGVIHTERGRTRLEVPLGTVVAERDRPGGTLRFSPDGKLVAVQWLDGGSPVLALADPARPVSDRLTTLVKQSLAGYCWAPGGQEVRYMQNRAGISEIRSVSVSGRDRSLMNLPGEFVLQDCRNDGAILVERVNTSSEISGFFPGTPGERDLSWLDSSEAADLSPDGSTLLIGETVARFGAVQRTVYLRKTDGSPAFRLGAGRPLALSPDGQWALVRVAGPPVEHVLLPTGAGQARHHSAGRLLVNPGAGAGWFPDSRRFFFNAFTSGARQRCYAQSIDGGDPTPLTPEEVGGCRLLSPDGRFALVRDARLFDLAAGSVRPVPGLAASDEVIRWSLDGRLIFVVERVTGASARVHRVDIATGRRDLVRELRTAGPIGAGGLTSVKVSADGSVVVYTSDRYFSDLLLIEGLR